MVAHFLYIDVLPRSKYNMEFEDLRTDQEKKQDAFDEFLRGGEIGQKARIIFCGDLFEVQLLSRSDNDGLYLVSLKIDGEKHGYEGENLVFNINSPDDSELIELI